MSEKELRHVSDLAGAGAVVLLITTPATWWLTGELGVLGISKLVLGLLLLTVRVVVRSRLRAEIVDTPKDRPMRRIARLWYLAAAVILLGPVNYFLSSSELELDLTAHQIHTLAPQTVDTMKDLKKPVHAMAFWSRQDAGFRTVQMRLQRYAGMNSNFTFEMIEPEERTDLEEKYEIPDNVNEIIITSGERVARSKYGLEDELTAAVVRVSAPTNKTVAFLMGHGERDTKDEGPSGINVFAEAVANEGYDVEQLSWNLAGVSKGGAVDGRLVVPEHIRILVVAGGEEPWSEQELGAVFHFWLNGGRLMLLSDSGTPTGVELVKRFGWALEDDLLLEENAMTQVVGLGASTPIVQPVYSAHPIVERGLAPVIVRTARTLKVTAPREDPMDRGYLLEASKAAWGETSYKSGVLQKGADDNQGQDGGLFVAGVVMADIARSPNDEPHTACAVIVGDSDFVTNRLIDKQGNLDFAVNSVHWLAEEGERMTVRPHRRTASLLALNGRQMGVLKFFAVELVPVMLVLIGFVIVVDRRRR